MTQKTIDKNYLRYNTVIKLITQKYECCIPNTGMTTTINNNNNRSTYIPFRHKYFDQFNQKNYEEKKITSAKGIHHTCFCLY